MKKLTIPTIILSTLLFACAGEVEQAEATATETIQETVEEIIEVPELAIVELNVEATSNGANLKINNPFSSTGVGFCVKAVKINGADALPSPIEDEADVYEIDLSSIGINEGDAYTIVVMHEEGCLPEVITE